MPQSTTTIGDREMRFSQTSVFLGRRAIVAGAWSILLAACHDLCCAATDGVACAGPPLPSDSAAKVNEPVGSAGILKLCAEPQSRSASVKPVQVERYKYARGLPSVAEQLSGSCAILFAISETKTSDVRLLVLLMPGRNWCRIRSMKLEYFGEEVLLHNAPIVITGRANVLHLRMKQPIYTHYSALLKGDESREAVAMSLMSSKPQRALQDDNLSSYGWSEYQLLGHAGPFDLPAKEQADMPSETNYLWVTEFDAEFK